MSADCVLSNYFSHEQICTVFSVFPNFTPANFCILAGGRGTSTIIKFFVADKAIVCRLVDRTRPIFFISPEDEMIHMVAANALGLTPKLYYIDSEVGIILMEYVHDLRLEIQKLENKQDNTIPYSKLALAIKKLHDSECITSKETSIFTDVLVAANGSKDQFLPFEAKEVLQKILLLEKVLKPHQIVRPCHKELNGNNVLFNGEQVYLIDWEGSGPCDPFVDLATLSIFFIFDSHNEEDFLKCYFGESPSDKQKAHLFLMKQICLAFYAFKSLRRVTKLGNMDLSQEKIDWDNYPAYKEMVFTFFNCCTRSISIEEFKILSCVFLREVMRNITSQQFQNAIQFLE